MDTQNIDGWNIHNIENLPKHEDDFYEYKSGLIKPDDLKNKISIAASAFSNTSGGYFIVGIDKNGNIDGINKHVGAQYIRDWIDQIMNIVPICKYKIKIIDLDDEKKCIIIIQFIPTANAPHMAYDNRYYIRVGARSLPASHYIVESIRLRAKSQRPKVFWRLIEHEKKSKIIRLALFTINDQSAYNVKIDFEKYPISFKANEYVFPLSIPIINKTYPFIMDIDIWGMANKMWGQDKLNLLLEYENEIGELFKENYLIDKEKCLYPYTFGTDELKEIEKAIKELSMIVKKSIK